MAEVPSLLPLIVWLSPAFPVGGFAYSHGLEWAFEVGDVPDAPALLAWVRDLAEHGSLRTDLVLASIAHRATEAGDEAALAEVAELAPALSPSRERRLETVQQGEAFVLAANAAWPCAGLGRLAAAWDGEVAYPVALGVTAAGHGLPSGPVLEALALALASNLVSAAIRLGITGQTDGLRIIAALTSSLREAAAFAHDANLDDLGSCALRSDLASLRHETQYTRLFRS